MSHLRSLFLFSFATLGLVAAGCTAPSSTTRPQTTSVQIPNGPRLTLPPGFQSKIEGRIVRLTRGAHDTERCAVELQTIADSNPVHALEMHYQPESVTRCEDRGCQTSEGLFLPISKDGNLLAMPTPPGNADRIALVRAFPTQSVLLTFCKNDPTIDETTARQLLLQSLKP
jgi:hypothetical protein